MRDEVKRMQSALEERPHIRRLGRLFSETVLLRVGAVEHYLVFEKGRLAAVLPGPSKKIPYRFGIVTDDDAR